MKDQPPTPDGLDDAPDYRGRPLFGCAKQCAFVDECEDDKDCIALHPVKHIEPWTYKP